MKIFLATPMSGFSGTELLKYKEEAETLAKLLEEGGHIVHSVVSKISNEADFDTPADSLKLDSTEIQKADVFILLYPKPMITSVLIELGIAIALNKKIIVAAPQRKVLPWCAQEIDRAFKNASFIQAVNLNIECAKKILEILR